MAGACLIAPRADQGGCGLSQAGGLLLPACGEKVGMRGPCRESELARTPLTRPSSFPIPAVWPSPRTRGEDAAAATQRCSYFNVSFCTRILPISPT